MITYRKYAVISGDLKIHKREGLPDDMDLLGQKNSVLVKEPQNMMRRKSTIPTFILSFIAVIFFLLTSCGDKSDLNTLAGQAKPAPMNSGIMNMTKIAPENTGLVSYTDIKEVRLDNDLEELLERYEKDFKYLLDYGVTPHEVEFTGLVLTIDGPGGFGVAGGDLNHENIRKYLLDEGFQHNEYTGIDYWYNNIGGRANVIHNDMLIGGGEDNVKACIQVLAGDAESLYDKNQYIRDIIARLPSGVMYVIGANLNKPAWPGAVAFGASYAKIDKNLTKVQGSITFENEDYAKDFENKLKSRLEKIPDVFNPVVNQNGQFLEFSAETGWEHGALFW
jgi:hypothetical protein